MADVTVYGFPISTFANIVRVVLTEKRVAFDFRDLEHEMGGPSHLALHPFKPRTHAHAWRLHSCRP
jgi:glutathione S-transferase